MKTIYLHIGIGKTGTTTIQKCLSLNHELMLSHNMHYVQSCGGSAGVGHQNFAKSFITEMPSYMQPIKNSEDLLTAVVEEIKQSNAHNFLFSSENFPVADPVKIKSFFDGLRENFAYKVILFVRSQDELAESEYNQMIKVRTEPRSFFEYVDSEFEANFMQLATQWERVFGQESMLCRVYDAKCQSVMFDFLRCLPLDYVEVSESLSSLDRKDNKSIGHAQLVIKRMMNILQPSKHNNDHVELPQAVSALFNTMDIATVHMSSKQAKKFRRRYKKVNRQFNRRYLGLNSIDLGGRRYTDEQRDEYFYNCQQLIDISGSLS